MKRLLCLLTMLLGCVQEPMPSDTGAPLTTASVLFLVPDQAPIGSMVTLQTAIIGADLSGLTARDFSFSNCSDDEVHVIAFAIRNVSALSVYTSVASTARPKDCGTFYVADMSLTHALCLVP